MVKIDKNDVEKVLAFEAQGELTGCSACNRAARCQPIDGHRVCYLCADMFESMRNQFAFARSKGVTHMCFDKGAMEMFIRGTAPYDEAVTAGRRLMSINDQAALAGVTLAAVRFTAEIYGNIMPTELGMENGMEHVDHAVRAEQHEQRDQYAAHAELRRQRRELVDCAVSGLEESGQHGWELSRRARHGVAHASEDMGNAHTPAVVGCNQRHHGHGCVRHTRGCPRACSARCPL